MTIILNQDTATMAAKISAQRFLRFACDQDENAAEYSSDLYIAYQKWCSWVNVSPASSTAFGMALGALGSPVFRHGKARNKARKGIRFKPDLRPELVPSSQEIDLFRKAFGA